MFDWGIFSSSATYSLFDADLSCSIIRCWAALMTPLCQPCLPEFICDILLILYSLPVAEMGTEYRNEHDNGEDADKQQSSLSSLIAENNKAMMVL